MTRWIVLATLVLAGCDDTAYRHARWVESREICAAKMSFAKTQADTMDVALNQGGSFRTCAEYLSQPAPPITDSSHPTGIWLSIVALYLLGALLSVLVFARHWPDFIAEGAWIPLGIFWPLAVPGRIIVVAATRFQEAITWYAKPIVPENEPDDD